MWLDIWAFHHPQFTEMVERKEDPFKCFGEKSIRFSRKEVDTWIKNTRRQLLVVDEASLMGPLKFQELLKRTKSSDAVFLIGDGKQELPIDAGRFSTKYRKSSLRKRCVCRRMSGKRIHSSENLCGLWLTPEKR